MLFCILPCNNVVWTRSSVSFHAVIIFLIFFFPFSDQTAMHRCKCHVWHCRLAAKILIAVALTLQVRESDLNPVERPPGIGIILTLKS